MKTLAREYGPQPLKDPFHNGERVILHDTAFEIAASANTISLSAVHALDSRLECIPKAIGLLTSEFPAFGELYGASSLEESTLSLILPTTTALEGFKRKELIAAGAFGFQFALASNNPKKFGNTPIVEYAAYLLAGICAASTDPRTCIHDIVDHGPVAKSQPQQSVSVYRYLLQDALTLLSSDITRAKLYLTELGNAFDETTGFGIPTTNAEIAPTRLVQCFMDRVGVYAGNNRHFKHIQQRAEDIINAFPIQNMAGNSVSVLEWESSEELIAHYERVWKILRANPPILANQVHADSMAIVA